MAQTLTEHRHLQLPIPTSLAGHIHLVWGSRSPKAAGGDDIHPLSFWKGTPKRCPRHEGQQRALHRAHRAAGTHVPASSPRSLFITRSD